MKLLEQLVLDVERVQYEFLNTNRVDNLDLRRFAFACGSEVRIGVDGRELTGTLISRSAFVWRTKVLAIPEMKENAFATRCKAKLDFWALWNPLSDADGTAIDRESEAKVGEFIHLLPGRVGHGDEPELDPTFPLEMQLGSVAWWTLERFQVPRLVLN